MDALTTKRVVNIPTEMWVNIVNGCTQRISWDDLIKVIRNSESTNKIEAEIQSAIKVKASRKDIRLAFICDFLLNIDANLICI